MEAEKLVEIDLEEEELVERGRWEISWERV